MSDGHSQSEKTIKSLEPGEWLWRDGIGYRRNNSGNGGSWYIKYRAPVQGDYGPEITPPMRQVKERLPNCKNRTQAAKVLAARKAAVFQGTYQQKRKAAPTCLETYLPRFLAAKRHLKTVKKYEQQLRQYLIPFFKKKPLEAITQSDCQEYYNHRLDSDAAISTVNGEIACLKSLLSEATREGIISANPAKAVRLLNPNNVRDRILSSEETARLFIAADEQPDFVRPLFHTLFHTGMRLGEALALEWADIQHEHNRIVIRQSKSGEGRKAPLRDVLADGFGDPETLLAATSGQCDDKLIAAIARVKLTIIKNLPHSLSSFFKNHIPQTMTISIINQLKPVQVHHKNSKLAAMLLSFYQSFL